MQIPRVMKRGNFKMGLNETSLGVNCNFYAREAFAACTGRRRAEWFVGAGLLFGPDKALEIGLVDELGETDREVEERASKALSI